jgi:hypothetical protein
MLQKKLFDAAIGTPAAHQPGVDRQRVTFNLGNEAIVSESAPQ